MLGLVETVDLVNEDERTAPFVLESLAGAVQGCPQILHPARHGAKRDELLFDRSCQHAGQGCLARAGGSPQDDRADPAALHNRPQWSPRIRQVRLADDFVERGRTQPLGERGAASQVIESRFVEEVHGVSISSGRPNPLATVFEILPTITLRNACRNDWETVVLYSGL